MSGPDFITRDQEARLRTHRKWGQLQMRACEGLVGSAPLLVMPDGGAARPGGGGPALTGSESGHCCFWNVPDNARNHKHGGADVIDVSGGGRVRRLWLCPKAGELIGEGEARYS